jgi:hypothetical protein
MPGPEQMQETTNNLFQCTAMKLEFGASRIRGISSCTIAMSPFIVLSQLLSIKYPVIYTTI